MIVNPFSGHGAGRKVYTTSVEPLLRAAGISYMMRGVIFFLTLVLAEALEELIEILLHLIHADF